MDPSTSLHNPNIAPDSITGGSDVTFYDLDQYPTLTEEEHLMYETLLRSLADLGIHCSAEPPVAAAGEQQAGGTTADSDEGGFAGGAMNLGDDEGLDLESSVAQAFARILAILDASHQTRENDHEGYVQAFGRIIAILQTLDSVRGDDNEKYIQAFAKSNQALEMLGMLWNQLSSKIETQDAYLDAMKHTIQEKNESLERFQNDVRQQRDDDRDTLIQQFQLELERSRNASRQKTQQECELVRNEAREARRELESTQERMTERVDRNLVVAEEEVQSMKRTIDARACTKEAAAALVADLAANLAAEQDRIKSIIDTRLYTRNDAGTLANHLNRAFSGELGSGLSRAIENVNGRLEEYSRRSSDRLDRLTGDLAQRDERCEEHARKAKRSWDEVFSRSGENTSATSPDQVSHHEAQEVLYPDLGPALSRERTMAVQGAVPERPSSRRRVSDRPQIHLVIPVAETIPAPVDNPDAPVNNLDAPQTIPAAVHDPGDMDGTDANHHLGAMDHTNPLDIHDAIDRPHDLDHPATINNSPTPDNPDIIEIGSSGSSDSSNGNSPSPADDFRSPFYHERDSAPSLSHSPYPPPAPRRHSSIVLSPVHAGLRRCWHRLSGGFCAELSYRSDGEEESAVPWRCAYHRACGIFLGRG
ncbi:MAG: hypothetical protein Q9173_004457 [Seirophora scorigena]